MYQNWLNGPKLTESKGSGPIWTKLNWSGPNGHMDQIERNGPNKPKWTE